MKRRSAAIAVAVLAAAALLLAAMVVVLNRDDASDDRGGDVGAAISDAAMPALVARGEYLVRAGSCYGCHTEPGGAPYAGGGVIETPFGAVSAPNLTPDPSGLGAWTRADFWRALHNGRSRDGRLLYPAFPYPNYTRLTRADADAMFAYLRSLAPVVRARRPHALRFPFDQQASLAVWRALFFRPARFEPDSSKSPQWNRGAYLVETLGHCNACHSRRNAFGATAGPLDLAGGLIPIQNWYAPSLRDNAEAGVGDWPESEVVALLRDGVSARGSVQGPMAEVVARSTQFLSGDDLAAMAVYLSACPTGAPRGNRRARRPRRGERTRRAPLHRSLRGVPRRARRRRARRLSGAGGQPRGRDHATGEPRAHGAARRLPADDARQSAPVRHAAVRQRALRRRHRRAAHVPARRLGTRSPEVSALEVSRYRGGR